MFLTALKIIEFNREILKIKDRKKKVLSNDEAEFSLKCLNEEASEFMNAHLEGDYIGCVDATLDSIYFAIGILYKLGLSAEEIKGAMTIVHDANMQKRRGINTKRDTGAADAIKPKGWIPPEQRLMTYLFGD